MDTLVLYSGLLKQATFDKIGYGQPYSSVLLTEGNYTVATPLKLRSGTRITSEKNAVISLVDNANPTLFQPMIPIFGQAENTIRDIILENFTYYGNRDRQDATPAWQGKTGKEAPKRHGQGYHNLAGFTNCENIIMRNVTIRHTLGDGLRLKNATGAFFYENNVVEVGHDGFYVDCGNNVGAWGNYVELKVNSAIRYRGVHQGKIYNNKIINKVAGASTGPGIQLEVSTSTGTSSGILVENNSISGNWGPAMWVICTTNPSTNAAKDLTIRGNTFSNCGLNPNISGVAGVNVDGWTNIKIENNVFDSCKGYGLMFGSYITSSAGSGYTAEVRNNIFKNTQKSAMEGTASGTAIANLSPSKYSISSINNTFINNFRDYYNVKGEGDRFGNPSLVLIRCAEDKVSEIMQAAGDNTVFRKL